MSLVFLDTNVLVYAFDADAGGKYEKAQAILKECWDNQSGTISTQVLQEFYVTITRKLSNKVDKQVARNIVQTYKAWQLHSITPDDIIEASEFEEQNKFSFWDSLVVVAAQKTGASILYSEDMQDKRIGNLTIINPFK
jgi:predicted nucleic acid-binding protein